MSMIRLNEITLGTGGATGAIFGICTTNELMSAFILGLVGAIGGLIVNILYRWVKKKLKL